MAIDGESLLIGIAVGLILTYLYKLIELEILEIKQKKYAIADLGGKDE